MEAAYKIPGATGIGYVHLKVSNPGKAIRFYLDLLAFEVTALIRGHAAFLSARG